MIRTLTLLPLAALLAVLPIAAQAQAVEFITVDEVREGMRGTGRTVFHGTTVEDFDVEILGVLKNSGPRQDMVLARLSGGPLAETGVLQGMSGSPVYIDGRLLGAVAFAFEFAKEPIAGIQPISQMVSILDQPAGALAAALPDESPTEFVTRMSTAMAAAAPIEEHVLPSGWKSGPVAASLQSAGLRPILTPLFISGASVQALTRFGSVFHEFGFTPVQGGGAGSASHLAAVPEGDIVPGSSINAQLVRGDINLSANGTVTHVDGDKVYAFGHPFQSTGPTAMPMSRGYVVSLVPSRATSFKLAIPLDTVGSFEQDRSTGVFGRLGSAPRMIPVRVEVETSRRSLETYEYEVVNDRFLTPFMMNFTLFNVILATERGLGASTLEVSGQIRLRGGEQIEIGNAFAGDVNGPAQATLATVAPITYLLSGGFDSLSIESVDLRIRSTDAKRSARLDAVWVDRAEVRAGETIRLKVTLRSADGSPIVAEYPVTIPAGLAPGRVQLVVGDGLSMTASDLRRAPPSAPRDVEHVIHELNNLRKMDRLYVKILSAAPGAVIAGQELPSLPPSMISLLETRRGTDSHTAGTRSSPVSDLDLGPINFVVQGQRSLSLSVIP